MAFDTFALIAPAVPDQRRTCVYCCLRLRAELLLQSMVRNVILTLLLGIVLALQGVVGCDLAHARSDVVAAGHCEDMAMNTDLREDMAPKHKSPSPDADSCATMCHLAVAHFTTPELLLIEMRAAVPDTRPLDNLAGDSIRPATPPPRMI